MDPQLVMVRWRDAHFDLEQTEVRADYIAVSVGWILPESNERFLVIASERLPDGDGYRAITKIPRETIQGRPVPLEVS